MSKVGFAFLLSIQICCFQWASTAKAAYSDPQFFGVQTEKERKIHAIRNEEIRTIRTALGLRAPENRKAELYLRLAELYLESYRSTFLLEGRVHESIVKTQPSARMDRERSRADLKNGIALAEQILSMKVDPSKLDKVYYFLGYNYGELGNSEKSLAYFQKLSESYPNSVFTIESEKALADAAFGQGNFELAESRYRLALKKTNDSAQQARVFHKLAWCYYRLKRTGPAIDAMKNAIGAAERDREKTLNIREEGLRDLSIFYAETSRVEEAISYFREHSGDDERFAKALEKLGREYERTGQSERAKTVYDALLRIPVQNESSFRATVKIVDLEILRQQFDSAADRLEKVTIPKSPDVDTNVVIQNLRALLRKTAVDFHDRYRRLAEDDRGEGRKLLQVADRFYWLYLKLFLSEPTTPREQQNEIKMYWAEVKRELNKPGDAAMLYRGVVMDRDPKYAKEAGQLWVSSLASELKRKAAEGEKPGPIPSDLEREFVDASDVLEKSIPNSTESREARLRSAQILAAYSGEKANAIGRASKLMREAPNTPQGLLAARLYLQLSTDPETVQVLKDTPGLLEFDRTNKGELTKAIELAETKFKVGEIAAFEKSKNFGEAGKGYEDFARKAKTEKEAEKAYMGAISAHAQTGNSERVAVLMREWRGRFPGNKKVLGIVKSQATQLFVRGLFGESAELFLGIGKEFKEEASYLTAAALFDGGLQRQKAREVYRLSLPLASGEEGRAKTRREIAEVSTDLNDELGAFNEYKNCFALNSSYRAECGCQIGNYYLKMNDIRQAKQIFDQVVSIKTGLSAKSPYLAYAQFRLAQILEREMKQPALDYPVDRILNSFNRRVEELKPVSEAYQKAIALGGPWGVAATERLGDLALGLSSEVERVLAQPEANDVLRQGLGPVANALKNKALENSRNAYRDALRGQILSPALPVIHDRLVDAGMKDAAGGTMNRAQGARIGIRLIGIAADGGKLGRENAMADIREKLLKSMDSPLLWIDYGNLLWGIGKPGLSKVAYQRAVELKTRMADALNNVAVVMVSDKGLENWFAANEAAVTWKKALRYEPKNLAALFNLGHYFNYFRLFPLAIPYFEQMQDGLSIGELHDGLGVAYFAIGKKGEANLQFKRAEDLDQDSDRFVKKYIEAAQDFSEGNRKDCLKNLNRIEGASELKGFEKVSTERLKVRCT